MQVKTFKIECGEMLEKKINEWLDKMAKDKLCVDICKIIQIGLNNNGCNTCQGCVYAVTYQVYPIVQTCNCYCGF